MVIRFSLVLILFFQFQLMAQVVKTKAKPPLTTRSFYFGSVSYNWWQENIQMTDPERRTYGLVTNTHGPCLGLGYFKRTGNWDISGSVCVFFGRSDISSAESNTLYPYSQLAVETVAAFFGPGIHYRPTSQASIGLVIPGFFRRAEWTVPRSGWAVEPVSKFSAGALLDAQWRLKRVVIHQRTGPIFNVGWVWSLGLDYIF